MNTKNVTQVGGGGAKPTNEGATDKDKDNEETEDEKDGESRATDGAVDAAKKVIEIGNEDLTSDDNTLRDGWYDVESVLQAAKDAFGKPPPQPGSNSQITALTGLNAADSVSKLAVYLTEASSSYIADNNPNRTSTNQKITPEEYIPGLYYYVTGYNGPGFDYDENGKYESALPSDVESYGCGIADAKYPFYAPHTFDTWEDDGDPIPTPTSPMTGLIRLRGQNGEYTSNIPFPAGCIDCSQNPPDIDPFACPILAPTALWLNIGVIQMAWATNTSAQVPPFSTDMAAKFVMHPYASDRLPAYEGGVSVIDTVTSAGNDVRIGPLGAGGFYIHYRDSSGAPTGGANDPTVVKINQNLTHGGFISPNQLSKLLPI